MPAPAEGEKPKGRNDAVRLLLASSNPGKLREYRTLALAGPPDLHLELELLPHFSELPRFEESAPTFAENAAGKALHYSRFTELPVLADDSGLAVDALGGAPGVHSARYAGAGASDGERIVKLLGELRSRHGSDRRARFLCVLALAKRERIVGVFSDRVEGEILDAPRGADGFGYDPIFYVHALGKTFAEIPAEEKNLYSHRGKAFRKLLEFLASSPVI
jgi:XTP/dITP diphosphohydrolase